MYTSCERSYIGDEEYWEIQKHPCGSYMRMILEPATPAQDSTTDYPRVSLFTPLPCDARTPIVPKFQCFQQFVIQHLHAHLPFPFYTSVAQPTCVSPTNLTNPNTSHSVCNLRRRAHSLSFHGHYPHIHHQRAHAHIDRYLTFPRLLSSDSPKNFPEHFSLPPITRVRTLSQVQSRRPARHFARRVLLRRGQTQVV